MVVLPRRESRLMARQALDPSRELKDPATPFARVQKLLKELPDDVSSELAATVALALRDDRSWWGFARTASALPERVIRVMLERLRAEPASRLSIFLVAVLDGSNDLERDWERGLAALLDLNTTYAWGSRQRKAKLAALAKGPLLPAIQAAAAMGQGPTLDMLAVLAADGSDVSADALMPHFHAAASSKSDLLNHLERLKTHAAKTAPMRHLFESVEALLGARNDESPALAFARRIGFDVDTFSAHWSLSSVETNASSGGVSEYQCHAQVDSTSANWFRVDVTHVPGVLSDHRSTSFGEGGRPHDADQLGLGRCTADALPSWFATVGKALGVHWRVSLWSSSLRGARRERLLAWMRGDAPSAQVTGPRARSRSPARRRAGSR